MRRAGSAVTLKKIQPPSEVRWEQGEEVEVERSSLFSSLDSPAGGEREFFAPTMYVGTRVRKEVRTFQVTCTYITCVHVCQFSDNTHR